MGSWTRTPPSRCIFFPVVPPSASRAVAYLYSTIRPADVTTIRDGGIVGVQVRRDCAATSITNRALALVGQIAASEMTLGNLDPDQPALGGVGKIQAHPTSISAPSRCAYFRG